VGLFVHPLSFLGNGSVKTFPLQRRIVGGFKFFTICVVPNSSQNFLFKAGYSATVSIRLDSVADETVNAFGVASGMRISMWKLNYSEKIRLDAALSTTKGLT
jgi:hypothetical protein